MNIVLACEKETIMKLQLILFHFNIYLRSAAVSQMFIIKKYFSDHFKFS
jgi:hypothetical protein